MRAKRIPQYERLRLITECRQSGFSDYQWCRMHDIHPGTFYNWISRFRKRGIGNRKSVFKETTIPVVEMKGICISSDC